MYEMFEVVELAVDIKVGDTIYPKGTTATYVNAHLDEDNVTLNHVKLHKGYGYGDEVLLKNFEIAPYVPEGGLS